MQKQVTYTKFIPRMFSATIDFFILSIILTPVMSVISVSIYSYVFQDIFQEYGINIHSAQAVSQIISSPEFLSKMLFTNPTRYLVTFAIINLISILMTCMYFFFFWRKFGATPGKIIMRMRIVSANNLGKPTNMQLLKRLFGYVTALIGIWSICFNKKGLALHDKIAGTVVIKS